ncbi:MAG: cupin domain-containing protein [Verrucomicrobia bacterium]|jgi:cupin 2 domain-containing protein|nr:cupin domain-containing protein [Verrucomicrobiota bacterium]MDB4746512.1 cupin domain-containing protein [Verrucomicrobiota bacterium]
MLPDIHNLFHESHSSKEETISEFLSGNQFRLEHIVSRGQASPDDSWYDQDQDEWVALISGQARLLFNDGILDLVAGDSLVIPAHQKHRVSSTSADAVWLALHFNQAPSQQPSPIENG